ncbi:MAG: response regulator [Bdellovibrionales bacterium]|nr:response regulator [Bdellovibrionales bacterium]
MALRVLLADESSTIKKVFQLALQDYAVEVKSVNLGVDVLPVAQKFNPDIVFADVLLQKQSGYEVSAELKGDAQLQRTPVVLMWSGFMELDQDKFEASGANAQLEKPFDVKALRTLIQNLVPKTQSQDLSKFLKFPKMPEFVDEKMPGPKAAAPPTSPSLEDSQTSSDWSMEDFADVPEVVPEAPTLVHELDDLSGDLEGFEQVTLSGAQNTGNTPPPISGPSDEDLLVDSPEDSQSNWEQEDLTRFRVTIPDDDQFDTPEVKYPDPDDSLEQVQLVSETTKPMPQKMESVPPAIPSKGPADDLLEENSVPIVTSSPGSPEDSDLELELEEVDTEEAEEGDLAPIRRIDPARVEEIVKAQIEEFMRDKVAEHLEEVIWKVVPELAERIIERELKRLLEDFEPQQYR